jgi:hypothetical protein
MPYPTRSDKMGFKYRSPNLLSRNSLVRRNSSGAKARVLLGEESSKYPIAKSEHDAKVAQAWGA